MYRVAELLRLAGPFDEARLPAPKVLLQRIDQAENDEAAQEKVPDIGRYGAQDGDGQAHYHNDDKTQPQTFATTPPGHV